MSQSVLIGSYIVFMIVGAVFVFGMIMIRYPQTFCKKDPEDMKKVRRRGWVMLGIAVILYVLINTFLNVYFWEDLWP